MPLTGFKLTITVFKRGKAFHALDRAATVTAEIQLYTAYKPSLFNYYLENPKTC
jgi:hypothetical protein